MTEQLFDEEIRLPDRRAKERFDTLVGLDDTKAALAKRAAVLLAPDALRDWSQRHYERLITAAQTVTRQPPLYVFHGDVGTGKSTLAETFAHAVAEKHQLSISVLRLSLRARGGGIVGEMTKLLGDAFDEVVRRGRSLGDRESLVLVIDEADALAQSRALAQMHHEDRAGVNALIRGVDAVAAEAQPVVVVMCTNRLDALDPAVRRRAAVEFEFPRPSEAMRREVFARGFRGCGMEPHLDEFARCTGDTGRGYGHTFSDLVQRVMPAAVLSAFPDDALTEYHVMTAIEMHPPTPPFSA